MTVTRDVAELLSLLRELSRQIRDAVLVACREHSIGELSRVSADAPEDTIFAIDKGCAVIRTMCVRH